jgi:hypothetical protein
MKKNRIKKLDLSIFETLNNFVGGVRDHMRIQGLPVEGGNGGGFSERPRHVILEDEEDYKSRFYKLQKEIEELAYMIMVKSCDKTVKEALESKAYYDKKPDNIKRNMINSFFPVYLQYDITDKDKEKFDALLDFINNYKLKIYFKWYKDKDKEPEEDGVFRPIKMYESDEIEIVIPYHLKEIVNDDFNEGKTESGNDLIYDLYKEDYLSTLIHELKHAYDYWISDGKAVYQSDEYRARKKKSDELKKSDNLESSEREFIDKQFKEYQNLPHEIQARLVQTAKSVDAYKMDYDTFKYYMIPWDEYYKNFTSNFSGWKNIPFKYKRRLDKKIKKYYWNQKIEMIEKNKKKED